MSILFSVTGNVKKYFQPLRKYQPHGPLVNSEFYEGHLTHWGEQIKPKNITTIVNTLKDLLDANASLNFYMFVGGTNFGFTSGRQYTLLALISVYFYS